MHDVDPAGTPITLHNMCRELHTSLDVVKRFTKIQALGAKRYCLKGMTYRVADFFLEGHSEDARVTATHGGSILHLSS